MAKLLYLVHRLPYPPNKGDKVRSFHMLKHLASKHRVFLGTFVDDPEDECHIEAVATMCSDLYVARLHPRRARPASLAGLCTGEPLTLRYYSDAGLRRWVQKICVEHDIDAALVFSSSMAQYTQDMQYLPMLVDFVDVDSAKWGQYANSLGWPRSWLYRRESTLLLAHERAVAARAEQSFFVTEQETALFRKLAPECASMVASLSNGVDSEYFSVDRARESPFGNYPGRAGAGEHLPVVFTGAMDYWPNVDAVTWFVDEILPPLLRLCPAVRFHIVGRNPSATVKALSSNVVEVTGTVPDIRPYLQHAAVVVAPLRLARGIQNKVLEAMAMGRPVVASDTCAHAIEAEADVELLAATTPMDFVRQVERLLKDAHLARAVGQAGRECVMRHYSWEAHLSHIDRALATISRVALAA